MTSLTTPAILLVGKSRGLNRLRFVCSIVPPGLWLVAFFLTAPASESAMVAAGLALGAVALLVRDICRRLDPRGLVLVVLDDEAALAASANNDGAAPAQLRSLQVVADLRCALWLLPMAAPATKSALLLCADALGEARWRGLRQKLALGSILFHVEEPLPPGWASTVSLPTASVCG